MDESISNAIGVTDGPDGAVFINEACHALLESARDIILLVRPDGHIMLANAAAERAYGWSRAELVGMSITELREPATREMVQAQLDTAGETGILFETFHVTRDGTAFPVEVSSRGVTIAGQRHVLSVVRDISARRRRERERDALVLDLERANHRLEGLLEIVSGAVGLMDPDKLLTRTIRGLRDVLEADGVLLFIAQGTRWRLHEQVGYQKLADEGFTLPMGEGFVSMIAESGAARWLSDVTDSPVRLDVHEEYGIRTMLGVPLYLEGELYGVLECAWRSVRTPSDAERVLLQVAADRVMAALESARRFDRAQRSRDIEAALAAAAAAMTSSNRLSETLPESLGVMASMLGCDAAAFGAYRGGVFEVQFGIGIESGAIAVPDHTDRVTAETAVPPIVRLDHASANPVLETLGWHEAIVTPVRVRGEWVGALLFGRTTDGGGFDEAAAEAVRRLSVILSLAYANARDFEAEHHIADVLQESLLRIETPVEGIVFGHTYRSSTLRTRVGGDLYDVFPLAGGLAGVLIGDVSGKGLEAAVFTTLVKQTLRAFAHESVSPADVLTRTNAVLAESSRMREFATVLFLVIDPSTGRTTYCRAGHPPALVVRGDGTVEETTVGSPVVGAFGEMRFEEGELSLAKGDLLVLHTDGVTEARDAVGEFFGEDRLNRLARSLAGMAPDEAVAAIDAAVLDFAGARLSDDVAVVAVTLG